MIYIAHRGNLFGSDINNENNPLYIQNALNNEFYVEIDVWLISKEIWLGHDKPKYKTNLEFLKSSEKIVCHAKNIDALLFLINENIHCFSHDKDDVVLTSKNWLWTFPNKQLTDKSICLMPEWNNFKDLTDDKKYFGVCSDFVGNLRKS